MKFKTILRESYGFMLVALAGVMLFPGNVSAAEKDDLFRKTDWDGSEKYIAWPGMPLFSDYNPEDKITFVGCDTPENYDKYMKALRDNTSDDVLVGLRSEKKCQLLSNASFDYYIKILSMDEDAGKVTKVMRDFDGFADGPFFTNIIPDKKLIRNSPYFESVEQNVRTLRKNYLERWQGKPFILTVGAFVCRSFYDYRKYKYDNNLKSHNQIWLDIMHKYESEGRCFDLDKGVEVEVVFENRYLDVEYKILSGEHKGEFVYADDRMR